METRAPDAIARWWRRAVRPAVATLFALAAGNVSTAPVSAETIRIASTTSTENSGLFGHILPLFTKKAGIGVQVVAVGTGQAVRIARNGDADVLLVHHRPSEEAFLADGFGVERHEVMYNDFVLVGPGTDPAQIRGLSRTAEAMTGIATARATFVSRGDDSGTHKLERELWKAGPGLPEPRRAPWYREAGTGMGATLNTAVAMEGYTLADRASWIAFRNKRDLEILVEGDPALRNVYGVILVSPARHRHVKEKAGQAFIDWLLSPEGQGAIAAFRRDGEPLFFPLHPAK